MSSTTPDLGHPVYHAVGAANLNDITPAKQMPIEPGATYVFDLGYYDYGWWAELDEAGCRIVTRFKTNTPLLNARDMPRDPGSDVLAHRIGFLPARQAKSRKNPMPVAVREVVVMTKKLASTCASSPTISTPLRRRLPISTSAAG